jgi:hypothetical protein
VCEKDADATTMTNSSAFALADDRSADRAETLRGFWFWYRNAREWGKPVTWSLRYARDARAQHQ